MAFWKLLPLWGLETAGTQTVNKQTRVFHPDLKEAWEVCTFRVSEGRRLRILEMKHFCHYFHRICCLLSVAQSDSGIHIFDFWGLKCVHRPCFTKFNSWQYVIDGNTWGKILELRVRCRRYSWDKVGGPMPGESGLTAVHIQGKITARQIPQTVELALRSELRPRDHIHNWPHPTWNCPINRVTICPFLKGYVLLFSIVS